MSMSVHDHTTVPAAPAENERFLQVTCLARYVRERRQLLGLTVAEAAEQSGLELSEWVALELAWVPRDHNNIRAIAATLQVSWTDLGTLAFFASLPLE